MPVHEKPLGERRGRGSLINYRPDLGFGHIDSHSGDVVRVLSRALQAAGWPSVGEEVTFFYDRDPAIGDLIAVGLRLTIPRLAG